ncbi:MAG: hypothetical protein KTQ49_02335, partial [Candidatus Omnitrophica bacterium]|nr:hypothetical protein [Candidatus Omnitrophota bacterium]
MISQYHSEHKSWVLRSLSIFVIFTFLVTQCDLQLLFAFGPAAMTSPVKTDKIHYMQDFEDLQNVLQGQVEENPLTGVSPDQAQAERPFSGDLPQDTAPDLSVSFLNGISPIVGAENKSVELTTRDPLNPDIVKVTYQDGTSFTYNSNPTSNRILEICDFTKPRLDGDGQQVMDAAGDPVFDLETRKFEWGGVDSSTGTPFVRIVTVGDGVTPSVYQKFTLTPSLPDGSGGQLARLLETGYLITDPKSGQDVEVLLTRDDGTRVTICDRDADPTYYIEKIYEKLPNGENRLLSYRKIGLVGDQVLATTDLEILYDDLKGIVTIVDRSVSGTPPSATVNFWEYELIARTGRGDLLAVGEMDRGSGDILSRMDITSTEYTITYPQTPDQMLVFERLPNGGFGRILRYRLGDLDLEYRYETTPATEQTAAQETITILDYRAGTFLRMGFVPGEAPEDTAGLIDSPQNILAAGTFLMVVTTPSYKNVLTRVGGTWVVEDPSDSQIFDVYEAFPNGSWGGIIRSRGPPEPGSELYVDVRYSYDVANQRVTAYDLTHQRYAIYDWKDPQTPRLLEQGDITVDASGNILSETATKTYNAEILGPVSVPSTEYDTEIAFASAMSALREVPGIKAPTIERLRILLDPDAPDQITVVLRAESTEYHYRFDTLTQSSLLYKMRIPAADGTYRIVEYDASGRPVEEFAETASGEVTPSLTYRYDNAGEVIILDRRTRTIRVAVLNPDGTIGQTLRSGFFNDADKIYSVQGPDEKSSRWFTYGADEVLLTEDDVATTRPVRGPSPGTMEGRPMLGGGENTELERKIQALRRMMREYEACTEENMRSDWRLSQKCEELIGGATALQRDIENEQYRVGAGLPLRLPEGGGGGIDLNYHNPAPSPAYIASLAGFGSAPIDHPLAVITDHADGSKTIALNGLVEIWRAGASGWGNGDDVLVQATETATNTTWYYTNGRPSRVVSVSDGTGTELARYEYTEPGRVSVIESSGARFDYSYTDERDPFGSAELVAARFLKDGAWVTQQYDDLGRLSSLCDGDGGNCTTYAYDAALNQAVLTSAAGTRIVALGGDGMLGTVDDFMVGGTDTGLEIQKDADARILGIVDRTYGTETWFSYSGTEVRIETSWS